jgi:hypothetical protein
MATVNTAAYAIRSHAAIFDRASLTGLNTRHSAHATTTSRTATRYRLRMPNRNMPSWSAMFLAVRAAFPGTTSPFTARNYPKAESTYMARSPTPAVVRALRIEWFVSAPPRRASSGGAPRSCPATDIVPAPREAVLESVGRVSVAFVAVPAMVDGLCRKLVVRLQRKEVKGIDVEGSRWLRRPSRPQCPGSP